jgi:hypothetical protein
LWACARANLVSGINISNKSACAIYLILDKINSISPESCHYLTSEQAYSGNEIASYLPPPQAIQPVISMPVCRFKFEIWDEGLLFFWKACGGGSHLTKIFWIHTVSFFDRQALWVFFPRPVSLEHKETFKKNYRLVEPNWSLPDDTSQILMAKWHSPPQSQLYIGL